MEEDALHKARRLTDYYDVHEEIGRYRATSMVGNRAPWGPQGQGCWNQAAPWGFASRD